MKQIQTRYEIIWKTQATKNRLTSASAGIPRSTKQVFAKSKISVYSVSHSLVKNGTRCTVLTLIIKR